MTSYYGRDGFSGYIERNAKADTFLYINKEKATKLSAESSTSWLEQLRNYDFNNIIRKTRANVKANSEKFSLRDTVEETKELVAVHNIHELDLIKSLQLGGLPMPSIAIIKASNGHSEYGDISLVFGKDTIDPQLFKSNKVYGGDAWTPTYPTVEYKVNEKIEKKVSNKYYELAQKYGYDETKAMYNYAQDLERELNRNNGEAGLLETLYKDTEMMQLFLLDSGKEKVAPVYTETRQELERFRKTKLQDISKIQDCLQKICVKLPRM